MNIGQCRNCKFWKQDRFDLFMVCHKLKEDDSLVDIEVDIAPYDAWLVTEEDFGCIQFEPKDEK